MHTASRKVEEYELNTTLDFGLFGSSGDPNKYYSDATAANIMPKEEDFIYVPFRLISATIVGGGSWKATNFSNEQVLKDSMHKLLGKPIFTGHEQEMDNWVGIVQSVKWAGASVQEGVKIPAGIEAILAIDAKTNPKIARGVLLGAIFSNSVTVAFGWKPSHDFGSIEAFEEKVGQTGPDSRMVTRDVMSIGDYYETSLVWLGADPYAKKIVEGRLVNVDIVNVVPFEKETAAYKKDHKYEIASSFSPAILSLSKSPQNQPPKNMNKFLEGLLVMLSVTEAQLRTSLGLDATAEITGDSIKGKLSFVSATPAITDEQKLKVTLFDNMLSTDSAKATFGETPKLDDVSFDAVVILKKGEHTALQASTTELVTVTAERDGLKTKLTELEPAAAMGTQYLSKKRDEAVRLYKLTAKDKATDAVVALFNSATTEQLDGLISQHLNGAAEEFGGKCKKCGSAEFDFQSSFTGGHSHAVELDEIEKGVSIAGMRKAFEKALPED